MGEKHLAKKYKYVIFLFVCIGFLCVYQLSRHSDINQLIHDTIGTDAPLVLIGKYSSSGDRSNDIILCLATDEAFPTYYNVELAKKWRRYECRKLVLIERGSGIYVSFWKKGYVFIIDNPAVAYIRFSSDIEDSIVNVSSQPFTYFWHWDNLGDRTDYSFYNSEDMEIDG